MRGGISFFLNKAFGKMLVYGSDHISIKNKGEI